jgi:hypothetical protein
VGAAGSTWVGAADSGDAATIPGSGSGAKVGSPRVAASLMLVRVPFLGRLYWLYASEECPVNCSGGGACW